ncbi:uncharacterized protein LOC131148101 [Malania oleifera]|uniref:uncharacterized protein LOC131148101 n=1 Tax=Malania oleifera TaxID=397392 RepID=UPI0025ADC2B4|nr:uncharacterized protein LOC131148101 [Malania oleifera]
MIHIGYQRCEYGCYIYVRKLMDMFLIFLLLYVDYMLIAAKDITEVNQLKTLLGKEFDMKDLGATKRILGLEIRKDRVAGRLWLFQVGYAEKVLERFRKANVKPVSTPLTSHFGLSTTQCPRVDDEVCDMSKVPYASVVGVFDVCHSVYEAKPSICCQRGEQVLHESGSTTLRCCEVYSQVEIVGDVTYILSRTHVLGKLREARSKTRSAVQNSDMQIAGSQAAVVELGDKRMSPRRGAYMVEPMQADLECDCELEEEDDLEEVEVGANEVGGPNDYVVQHEVVMPPKNTVMG